MLPAVYVCLRHRRSTAKIGDYISISQQQQQQQQQQQPSRLQQKHNPTLITATGQHTHEHHHRRLSLYNSVTLQCNFAIISHNHHISNTTQQT